MVQARAAQVRRFQAARREDDGDDGPEELHGPDGGEGPALEAGRHEKAQAEGDAEDGGEEVEEDEPELRDGGVRRAGVRGNEAGAGEIRRRDAPYRCR